MTAAGAGAASQERVCEALQSGRADARALRFSSAMDDAVGPPDGVAEAGSMYRQQSGSALCNLNLN